MEGEKNILASKTFWGGLVAVASGVLPFFIGVGVPETVQSSTTDLLVQGASAIGGLLAIYGRWTATKKVTIV